MSKAIHGSIKKWDRIVKDLCAEDKGRENCSLCIEYEDNGGGCGDCPVDIKTDGAGCTTTPYSDWSEHHGDVHDDNNDSVSRHKGCKECLRLAKEERDFLITLLPKKERARYE